MIAVVCIPLAGYGVPIQWRGRGWKSYIMCRHPLTPTPCWLLPADENKIKKLVVTKMNNQEYKVDSSGKEYYVDYICYLSKNKYKYTSNVSKSVHLLYISAHLALKNSIHEIFELAAIKIWTNQNHPTHNSNRFRNHAVRVFVPSTMSTGKGGKLYVADTIKEKNKNNINTMIMMRCTQALSSYRHLLLLVDLAKLSSKCDTSQRHGQYTCTTDLIAGSRKPGKTRTW
ncbi:hypothetical protein QTP88_018955 [Uroleucon formosanum]